MTPDDIRADMQAGALWYVGAMNDAKFIIDAPPRLSNDDVWHDRPDGPAMALRAHGLSAADAKAICDAHNAAIAALEQENKRLRDGIAYVLNKHPYGRLKRLMGDVLDGINPEKTEGSESRWNDRVSAAEAKARRADWALSKVMDALKEVSAIVGEKP